MTGTIKSAAIIFLVLISLILGVNFFNPAGSQVAAATSNNKHLPGSSISCIAPKNSAESTICDDIEVQILRATVHIVLHTWGPLNGQQQQTRYNSHATILAGKYLLTHNHYKYSLREQVEPFGQQNGYTGISLFGYGDRLILENAPLHSFHIVYQDAETFVLSFEDENGRGLFESKNLASADFTDLDLISLEAGDELAQVDWDGEQTHVDWVRADNVVLSYHTPYLEVGNFIRKGSSGGGVFLNGVHIGNNWLRDTKTDQKTGEVIGWNSTIALNSATMLDVNQ